MMKATRTDAELVEAAKEAHAQAEETEAGASPSRWIEADCYAELAERGWKQQRIAEECGVSQTTVSFFVRCTQLYYLGNKRPSFWTAYQEAKTGKTTAERIVASDENEWYTPEKYIEAARTVLGKIDLDPASSELANKTVKAKKFYTAEDDGLHQPWRGRLWLNPPYGRLAGEFVGRLVLEHEAGEVEAAILLVNAHCTDTDWYTPEKYIETARKLAALDCTQVWADGSDGVTVLFDAADFDRVAEIMQPKKRRAPLSPAQLQALAKGRHAPFGHLPLDKVDCRERQAPAMPLDGSQAVQDETHALSATHSEFPAQAGPFPVDCPQVAAGMLMGSIGP